MLYKNYISELLIVPLNTILSKKPTPGTGVSHLQCPCFRIKPPGILVKFKDLYIDKEYNVVAGYAETLYNPDNFTTQIADLNAFTKGGKLFEKIMTDDFDPNLEVKGVIGDATNIKVLKDGTGKPVSFTIDYATPSPTTGETEPSTALPTSGGVSIELSNNNVSESFNYYVIKDAENVYYGIDLKTGEVIPIGRYNPDIANILADIDINVINHDKKITFENGSGTTYAFDPANSEYSKNLLFSSFYMLGNEKTYSLRWKFMPVGSGTDKVVAIMPSEITQDKETLKFIVKSNSTEIDYTPGTKGQPITLNLMPATSDAEYSIHAVVKNKDTGKWEQAGRFDVLSRTTKTYNATLVALGGTLPSGIEADLNTIWKPYGITWKINVDDKFYDNTAIDDASKERVSVINGIVSEKLTTGDEFLSEYCQQQLDINRAYRDYLVANEKYSKEEMYMFVLPEGKAPDVNKLGDMPLGKQWGYLFGTPTAHTLAHELGHGKTKLEHTFKDDKIDQGSTTNLMDYSANDSLVRYQWQNIHDPAVFDPVQSDEDGATVSGLLSNIKWFNSQSSGVFLSPAAKPFWIDNVVKVAVIKSADETSGGFDPSSLLKEAIYGFELNDGIKYFADIKNDQFNGYYNTSESQVSYKTFPLTQNKVSGESFNVIAWDYSGNSLNTNLLYNNSWFNTPSNWQSYLASGWIPPVLGLLEGSGVEIYTYFNTSGINSDTKNLLIQLANKTSIAVESITGNEFVSGNLKSLLLEQGITDVYEFINTFKYVGPSRGSILFSKVDLWDALNWETYNQNSTDFITKGKYYYSVADLKARYLFFNYSEFSGFRTGILEYEKNGTACPLSINDTYDQYVEKYGTDYATFFWMQEVFPLVVEMPVVSAAQKVSGGLFKSQRVDEFGGTNYFLKKLAKTSEPTENITTTIANNIDELEPYVKRFVEIENHAEIIEETAEVSRPFWYRFQTNLTRELEKIYPSKVKSQVYLDVYYIDDITGIETKTTIIPDNLIDLGARKYKIAEAKTSIRRSLLEESDLSSTFTTGQKKTFARIENGTITKVMARGDNAAKQGVSITQEIFLDPKIDYYVNTSFTDVFQYTSRSKIKP